MNTISFEGAIAANWLRLTAQQPPAASEQSAASESRFDASGIDAADLDPNPAREGLAPVVLLVEDNHINQVVALEFLSVMGLQSRLAKNGLEALELCAAQAPDLVLMDIQMPGMDGLECTRRLREMQRQGALPSFPILALTAHALESDIAASLAAGMDEHLTKPLDFVALQARLGRWLQLPGLSS
ncbi:response regulator [Paucibacter sp. Y2R2-4]|uniref:response regulator n=1 Tax=Paucibacter sp. Y2R2-4 TaxID=2893553 RepID=UPI0021E3C40C|nr:response regulator [Paucibacter sp. Y2R2-4]MCV2352480.1 response regulator [Paucibacter sp. Y2R2-4]